MVSFSCEQCGDVLTKKKLDNHRNQCRNATFSCIDCMTHFYGVEYRAHTSCMTEAQKYEGGPSRNKKLKTAATVTATTTTNNTPAPAARTMHTAFVEDYEDFGDWEDDDHMALPHAPSPPRGDDIFGNVFDFMVDPTPNGSTTAINQDIFAPVRPADTQSVSTELVRYDHEANTYKDPLGFMVEERSTTVRYGTGPVPGTSDSFRTPATKGDRRHKHSDREVKKDKKRKRLHIDTRDHEMTDAPPVLQHSGLTGGLNRLLSRPQVFPPSPDASGSGGDVGDTPGSPLKRSRHSKKPGRIETIGNNLFSMLNGHSTSSTANIKTKSKKKRKIHSTSTPSGSKKRHEHRHKQIEGKEAKMIEYGKGAGKDDDSDKDEGPSGALVVFKPRADLFLSFVNKGPDSERGCSMNKALKRFHRERTNQPNSMSKLMEEKELWRSLRLRKNEAGEIVVFCV